MIPPESTAERCDDGAVRLARSIGVLACLTVPLVGCALGAGPVVGYGLRRGGFYGAEATAGLSIARAGIGWQSNARSLHIRAETTLDRAWEGRSHVGVIPSLRIGVGHVVSGEGQGMFLAGPSIGTLLRNQSCGPDDSHSTLIATVSVDVRYIAGDWQLALAPRIEGRSDPGSCLR